MGENTVGWKSEFTSKVLTDKFSTNIEGVSNNTPLFSPINQILILLTGVILLIVFLPSFNSQSKTQCIEWENKMVHTNAWTQYVWMGKTMMPIFHPGMDNLQNVCTKYGKKDI